MKHVSSRAANADNNRILTGRDINEIEFTPPIHANSVLGLTGRVILTGNAPDGSGCTLTIDMTVRVFLFTLRGN
ncbi:hypothetical protein EB653_25595 [Escherichia coli]|nr:hypothetical protein [Escherichia coli]